MRWFGRAWALPGPTVATPLLTIAYSGFFTLSTVEKGQITSNSTNWYRKPCVKRSNRRQPISTPHTLPYSLRLFLRVTSRGDRYSCRSSAVAASACGFGRSKVASWTLGCLCFPLRQKTRIHQSKPYRLYRPVRGYVLRDQMPGFRVHGHIFARAVPWEPIGRGQGVQCMAG